MVNSLIIRKALQSDYQLLTDISFKAKKYWKYPDKYYEIWKDELTITTDYIKNNLVYIAEFENKIIAYYSIVFYQNEYYLEHIFVLPEFIGNGIGTHLMEHARVIAKAEEIKELKIMVDPYAKGFYEKIGARFIENISSNIEGRKIPLFEIKL